MTDIEFAKSKRMELPRILSLCPELENVNILFHCLKNNYLKKMINPSRMGFIPKSCWLNEEISIEDLRRDYFLKRKGSFRRFDYKLYNALQITKCYADTYEVIGVQWINKNIMKIDSRIFGSLLGIHFVQGGLFHKQGNLCRHKFVHIYKSQVMNMEDNHLCDDVDDHIVRLFYDELNRFSIDKDYVTIDDINV